MRFRHAFPLLLSLLAMAATGTASAQSVPENGRWSGLVSLTAGGFIEMPEGSNHDFLDTLVRVRQSSEAFIKYDHKKFGASLQFKQSFDRKNTDSDKMVYVQQDSENYSQIDVSTRRVNTVQKQYDVRTDLRWSPSDRTRLTGYVLGSFNRDSSMNSIFQQKLMSDQTSVTMEDVDNRRDALGTGLRAEHQFGKSRSLTGNADWRREWDGKISDWSGIYVENDDPRSYRLTPYSVKDRVNATVFYRDTTFAGVSGLIFEPGARLTLNHDNDHYSGATQYPDGSWRDSLSLREDFMFIAMTLEPYVRTDYRKGKLSAYVEAGFQVYGTRLENEIRHQALIMQPVKPVGRLGGRWQFVPGHTVFWSGSLTVQRPAYQQICWYPRQGSYTNQLFIGNPGLKPAQLLSAQVGYRFQYKRFSAETTTSYSLRNDEVIRTFSDIEIDGRKFTQFTWVNAARTRTWIEKLTLGWDGTVVKANVSGLYHDLRQKQDPTDSVEDNRYWELNGNLQVLLPASWTLSADANYHSRIKTLYQIIDPYVRLNARVQKKFGLAWTLFLEGKDLLERPLGNGVISGFTKQTWYEETRQNRRIVQLGVVWQF